MKLKQIIKTLSICSITMIQSSNLYADLLGSTSSTPSTNKVNLPVSYVPQQENISLAIVDFRNERAFRQKITSIIKNDLAKTGQFKFTETAGVMPIPYEPKQVIFSDWRNRKADYLVIGKIVPIDVKSNRFDVQFRLFNTAKQQQIAGFGVIMNANQFREFGHQFSDMIYQSITGKISIFGSKISYIQKENNLYSLFIADYDGLNPQRIITSSKPILSPTWSPDGTKIAYVSYERNRPLVYIQSLSTGQRVLINFEDGANSSPAWSPDGKKLAFVISKNGASNIYTIHDNGINLKQLTTDQDAINTEPSWSPDSKDIIFTSDRDGLPQIYKMSAIDGSNRERINSRQSTYAVGGQISPDGQKLAYIQQTSYGKQVVVQSLHDEKFVYQSESNHDESPKFSANNQVLIYSTKINNYRILTMNSLDGKQKQKLYLPNTELFSPNWSKNLTN